MMSEEDDLSTDTGDIEGGDDAPFELTDDNYETDRTIGDGNLGAGFWVFEVTDNNDLYSHFFRTREDARAYIESNDYKAQLLSIENIGDAFSVKVEDHT